MKKYAIFSLLLTVLLLVGCDYNDKNFPGYDDIEIKDVVHFEGEFTGTYPAGTNYFVDKESAEAAIAKVLSVQFKYCDKGSTAKISSVAYGTVTPGWEKLTISKTYTLEEADYDSMGTGKNQPGQNNNFSSSIDPDKFLPAFCATKFADAEVGTIVEIVYAYYTGTILTKTRCYKKEATSWVPIDTFVADYTYTLQTADYDLMGMDDNQPGARDNFSSSINPDNYLPAFCPRVFIYGKLGTTGSIIYKYYDSDSKQTVDRKSTYIYNGVEWVKYDQYASIVTIEQKVAEMEYDGSTWELKRLMGGSKKILMGKDECRMLYDWVVANKDPKYLDSRGGTDEYYFGASAGYGNINNKYTTWKSYYDVTGEYKDLKDEQMQAIMDTRMEEGISQVVLPKLLGEEVDPGLSYVVSYKVYAGRGDGYYNMTFVYDDAKKTFTKTGGPTKE